MAINMAVVFVTINQSLRRRPQRAAPGGQGRPRTFAEQPPQRVLTLLSVQGIRCGGRTRHRGCRGRLHPRWRQRGGQGRAAAQRQGHAADGLRRCPIGGFCLSGQTKTRR